MPDIRPNDGRNFKSRKLEICVCVIEGLECDYYCCLYYKSIYLCLLDSSLHTQKNGLNLYLLLTTAHFILHLHHSKEHKAHFNRRSACLFWFLPQAKGWETLLLLILIIPKRIRLHTSQNQQKRLSHRKVRSISRNHNLSPECILLH